MILKPRHFTRSLCWESEQSMSALPRVSIFWMEFGCPPPRSCIGPGISPMMLPSAIWFNCPGKSPMMLPSAILFNCPGKRPMMLPSAILFNCPGKSPMMSPLATFFNGSGRKSNGGLNFASDLARHFVTSTWLWFPLQLCHNSQPRWKRILSWSGRRSNNFPFATFCNGSGKKCISFPTFVSDLARHAVTYLWLGVPLHVSFSSHPMWYSIFICEGSRSCILPSATFFSLSGKRSRTLPLATFCTGSGKKCISFPTFVSDLARHAVTCLWLGAPLQVSLSSHPMW